MTDIMKMNSISRIAAALFMGCALLASSCTKPEDDVENNGNNGNNNNNNEKPNTEVKKEDPSFPTLVENFDVKPGETLSLTFTPNYDWTVSVPAEIRQWFWIVDGSFKVSELSGKASESEVTVKIGVSETQEFDKNYSCDVTLSMDGQSEVIAKYMLPAKERTLEVYAAEWDADGALKLSDDGTSYVYSSVATETLELGWSAADADFRAPVKVDANCQWTVDIPSWASVNVPENTVGSVDIVFTGESLEGAEGDLVFKAGDLVLKTVKVSVPSCNDIKVYSAMISDDEFEYGEDGDYAWTAEPVTTVGIAWLGSDYRMPIKVESKCSWEVEVPEWLSVTLPEKTAGEVSLTLLGVPSKYPLEDAAGKIVFKNGTTVLSEIDVTIPGCQDMMTFSIDMSLTALEYNYLGEVNTSTGYIEGPATGRLSGVSGVRVFSVETTGEKVGAENPEWFKVEISSWNSAAGADVIQDRTLTFKAEENKGEARSAVLFVLPPSIEAKTADLFNEDASVKEEYKTYSVQVTQGSLKYDDYITMNVLEDAEFAYSFQKASEGKKSELTSMFGSTDHVYVLTYTSPYCRDNAFMTMAIPFTSYKVSATGDWLSYTNGSEVNNYGVVDMYKEMELPHEPSVGHVVFYNSENAVLAIVECVSPFVPEALAVDKTSMLFASDASQNTFAVTSNTDWTVESDSDWCTVAPASGRKDGTVTVSVTENPDSEVRKATLTIKSKTITHTVSVEQKFGEVLEASVYELEFGFAASSATIEIASNVAWTVESDSDWCKVTAAEGAITVSADKNKSEKARTAVLTLKSETIERTISVTQKGDDGSQTTDLSDDYGNIYDVYNSYFKDAAAAKAAGARMYVCKSGPYYEQYKSSGCPVLILEYKSLDTAVELVLPKVVAYWFVYPSTYNDYVSVNNETQYDTGGILGKATDKVTVRMNQELYDNMDIINDPDDKNCGLKLTFHTSKNLQDPVVAIFCKLDLSE